MKYKVQYFQWRGLWLDSLNEETYGTFSSKKKAQAAIAENAARYGIHLRYRVSPIKPEKKREKKVKK